VGCRGGAYETGWVDRVTFTQPENVKAYQALVELYSSYAAAGPSKGLSGWQGFSEGKIAMDWIGGWRMGTILDTRKGGGMSFGLALGPPPLVKNRANTRWTNPLFMSSATMKGKALGVPVYELLGGMVTNRVRVYANGWFAGAKKPHEFAASCSNFFMLETMVTDVPWRRDVATEHSTLENGCFVVPNAPGLGVQLHEEAFGRFRYSPRDLRHYTGKLTEIRPVDACAWYRTCADPEVAQGG
jgi:hypothetical protein